MSFISIILAIVIIGILIIIHEFGHYIVARKNGVFVKEFSVGFGPRIISHVGKKTGTRFSLKAIPFGGSCQMLGGLEDDEETDDERSYDNKSVWARISITLAGPVFNFLLAFVLAVIVIGTNGYDPAVVTTVAEGSPVAEAGLQEGDVICNYNGSSISFGREIYLENYIHPIESDDKPVEITYLRDGEKHTISVLPEEYEYYVLGLSYYATESKAELAEVTEGSPLDEAGLEAGDVITAINGTPIETGAQLGEYFDTHEVTDEPIEITYEHHGVEMTVTVTPTAAHAFRLGFGYNLQNVKTDVGGTLKYSLAEMKYQIVSVVKSLGVLLSGRGSLDMLSGPVGIVEAIGTTYDISAPSGFSTTVINLLGIMILLSTNLGVLNLLPLPALDGGRLLLLIIEVFRRKPMKKKYEGIITMVGAVLIMILAVVVLVNDVLKFF